jgi:small subunit ribosomal protein S13
MAKELRLIVRIANKDLNGRLPIYRALTALQGISHRIARMIAFQFEKESKIPFDSKLGEIPESLDKKLEDIILNPLNHGIPSWALNKRKEFESGKDLHFVMGDLQFSLRQDLQRLKKIKSYRGLRHSWGLPVRGQRTKSTHRGKGGVVGVFKKEAKSSGKSKKDSEKTQQKKSSGKGKK